jgi:hypothetical protein
VVPVLYYASYNSDDFDKKYSGLLTNSITQTSRLAARMGSPSIFTAQGKAAMSMFRFCSFITAGTVFSEVFYVKSVFEQ